MSAYEAALVVFVTGLAFLCCARLWNPRHWLYDLYCGLGVALVIIAGSLAVFSLLLSGLAYLDRVI